MQNLIKKLGSDAKKASRKIALESEQKINKTLQSIADQLRKNVKSILHANKNDITQAQDKGLSEALIDRLMLNEERIEAIAKAVENVIALPDPTGKILKEWTRPNGLIMQKTSVPIGVLGMIYESRPNVTIDAAALCLKSHNAVILRGGSESLNSSLALHTCIKAALKENDLPTACVSMIPSADRELVGDMLKADEYIDVIIPRGGKNLIERIRNEARMPVFSHLDGICHTYIHSSADHEMARKIVLNAKLRRTGVCNATETLLLDQDIDKHFAMLMLDDLLKEGCEIVGDKQVQNLDSRITPATNEDWSTEYLAPKISVKFVDDIHAAIDHINSYSSHHTDAIIAQDNDAAALFQKQVDSGSVMHNASTQFADGGEYGMGAEIGIATGKMHARGPVGIEQLTTYKYLVHGTGQIRPL